MGHERIGLLPKTHKWKEIIGSIANSGPGSSQVSDIAQKTAQGVRSRFRFIYADDGVKAAFTFLVALAVSARHDAPQSELLSLGIRVPNDPTPLALARSAHAWVDGKAGSLEYARIAESAAGDAIAIWSDQNKGGQTRLVGLADSSFDMWRRASDGSGFCELARIFFAKFTERYLNYFLERESSAVLPSILEREQFQQQMRAHVDQVSQHAFETAKITQSFAAGWFNKYAKAGMPPEHTIERFLSQAFGKIGEELRREGLEQ